MTNVWKKPIAVPIQKKDGTQILKSDRLTPLFPICVRIFEWIIYNVSFEDLTKNNPISENQYRFMPTDYCTNQLLLKTNDIHKSFYDD